MRQDFVGGVVCFILGLCVGCVRSRARALQSNTHLSFSLFSLKIRTSTEAELQQPKRNACDRSEERCFRSNGAQGLLGTFARCHRVDA